MALPEQGLRRELFSYTRALLDERFATLHWRTLEHALRAELLEARLPSPCTLPFAACAAVGGHPTQATPVAAAGLVFIQATRWLDDLADQDRDDALHLRVGTDRAILLSAGAMSVAWEILATTPRLAPEVLASFGRAVRASGVGQERDLAREVASLEAGWEVVRGKTGAGYAWLLRGGAEAAGCAPAAAELLGLAGEHLGVAIQLLDDLDSLYDPLGRDDVRSHNGVNLGVVRALFGPRAEQARALWTAHDVAGFRSLLSALGTRQALTAAAWTEVRLAREALAALPCSPGAAPWRDYLDAYAVQLFERLPPEAAEPGR
jgi:geranylgeranyl pyrophosphate synthase